MRLRLIREELLMKAQRDISKLVKVQRQVSRGGKLFTQNFYVLPSQVKSTDKVIGGQQNLLPTPGSVATPAAGVLDKAYLDSIKSDKIKALAYLKSCGIKWDEHNHAGINWMRAMQAVSAALNGQNSAKISNQVNVQAQPQTAQIAQNSQSGNQVTPSVTKDVSKAAAMLDQKTLDELSQCKNGREKVIVLKKKLGQDGCMKFAKLAGVTWDEHSNSPINNMRMSMALQKYYDAQDGTVSPNKVKGQGGGAPKGNKNAKKDSKPTVDPDKLKIPANATQRQTNLINLINSVDNIDELNVYTGVGMIAEDDVAKSFIFDKLSPKYTLFKNAHKKGSTPTTKANSSYNSSGGFGILLTDNLNINGCKKDVVKNGFSTWYSSFSAIQLTDPRETLCTSLYRTNKSIPCSDLVRHLQNAFSTYTTDEYKDKHKTNLGYTGWDSSIHAKQYDHNRDGFVRYLNKIAEENPNTKPQVEKMISQYDTIMEKVGYNPKLLYSVMDMSDWKTGENSGDGKGKVRAGWRIINDYGTLKPVDAKRTLEHMEYQAKVIPIILEKLGLSKEDIIKSLSNYYNSDLQHFRAAKSTGEFIGYLDLTKEIDDNTGKPYFDGYMEDEPPQGYHGFSSDDFILKYTLAQYSGTEPDSQTAEIIHKLKSVSSVSQSDFVEIHKLVNQLFGLKYTQKDSTNVKSDVTDLTYDTFMNISSGGGYSVKYSLEKDEDNPQLDLVLANLNMAYNSVIANESVASYVSHNSRSSLNNNGTDYSKNFSFYYPSDSQKQQSMRMKADYWGGFGSPVYTVDELNSQIDKQMKTTPTVSSQYLDNLTAFFNAKGNYDPDEVAKITQKYGLGSVVGKSDSLTLDDYVSDPMKDILFQASKNLLSNIPKMDTPKLDSLVAKNLDYVPYDFTAATQPTLSSLSAKPNKSTTVSKTELKQAREAAFKAIHCSISTEDEATSLQMRKDFLKNWDYQDGGSEKDPDGNVHTNRVYSGPKSYHGTDRRALFNSRFFKVNNSNMQENFDAYSTELSNDTSLSSSASKKMELLHACSYASTAGILGVTGGWFMGNQYTKVAKALGCGAYFGYKGGKSSVYCDEGSGGYHNIYASGSKGDNANGCYILATVMRGKPGESKSDAGGYRDFEICVKNNKCIFPHHFVDISARSLGVNVTRDAQGNYLDSTGKITHDKYGQAINMK